MQKRIFNRIIKYNTIVIARHTGPDPDALGSQIGLKELILHNFKDKKVYAVGAPTAKFKFLGHLDKLEDDFNYKEALLILLDTPDKKRIDGVNVKLFKDSIRIDHHPFIEKTCKLDWTDDMSSSTCQMIIELFQNKKYEITKSAAEKLFVGLVADTNRFLFNHSVESTIKTFGLAKSLLEKTQIDITPLYANLYMRSINEMKLQGHISQNMTITDNGVGYIRLTDELIKEFGVDSASAGNMVNNFNFITGILVWLMISEDKKQNLIRINIRSRGPIINRLAEQYNGGGHKYAAGARVKTDEEAKELIDKLDELCKEYKLEGVDEDENK